MRGGGLQYVKWHEEEEEEEEEDGGEELWP
jgi:hypothetical protein